MIVWKKEAGFVGRFIKVWVTAVAVLLCFGHATAEMKDAPSLTVEQIIEKVENRYSCESFSANFQQTSTLEAMGITDTASGQALFKRPRKIRWEYKSPLVQQIISDGEMLWIYKPEDNQVMVGKAPVFFAKGSGASFLAEIRSLRRDFVVTMAEKERQNETSYVLKLDWKQEKFDIGEIYVSVAKDTFDIISVETVATYGDTTLITFNDIALNQKLDDALFTFDIPITADIISLDN